MSPSSRTGIGRAWDVLAVLAISVFTAFLSGSRQWTGFNSPDSEFYASIAAFGTDVVDRSLEPAYYWTRLGYIAPVRGAIGWLGPWAGFALWRFVLILVIVGSVYWLVRQVSSRSLAVVLATGVSLSTVVLSFVGNTYLTGTVLAATILMLALGVWCIESTARRPWLPAALSGVVGAWLVMLNPYALFLGLAMWLGIRFIGLVTADDGRWAALARDAAAAAVGMIAGTAAFIGIGRIMFPGRDWIGTYLDWNSRLDYVDFIGDPDVWTHDVSLLVPAAAVAIAVISVAATRASRVSLVAVAVGAINIAYSYAFFRLVPGPWLEAPTYVAKLWPGALVAVALSFAAIAGKRRLSPVAWILALGFVPLLLWSGRWETTLDATTALAIVVATVAVFAAAGLACRRGAGVVASIMVVLSIGVALVGAQVLQNGRGLIGIYGQFPLRAAFVDFNGEQLMTAKIAAEQWVLDHTAAGDRIGIWTDPDRMMAQIAAMQLWGAYNNVSTGPVLNTAEVKELERIRPTALAMYAPTRAQVATFWGSIPPWALPSDPECTTVSFPGIGVEDSFVCVTKLNWVG